MHEHTILVRPAKVSAVGMGEVVVSSWLTNRDFVDFAIVEDRAFGGSVPRVKEETQPLESPITKPLVSSDGNEPEKPTSIYAIIGAKITTDPHTNRTKSLIHNALADPSTRFLKAFIPATGEIVGLAQWNVCLDADTSVRPHDMMWAEGSNVEFIDAFFGEMRRKEYAWMKGKRYLLMHALAILPAYQRKRIGTRLLDWGLEIADRERVECWIDASPAGLGLYKKLDWKEVGEMVIDLGDWGGKEGHTETVVHLVRAVQS